MDEFIYDGKLFAIAQGEIEGAQSTINSAISLGEAVVAAPPADCDFRGELVDAAEDLKQAKKYIDEFQKKVLAAAASVASLDSGFSESYNKQLSEIYKKRYNVDYSNIFKDGYTPQGITIVDGKVIISAYCDKKKSKLYVYDPYNSYNNFIVTLDTKAHVGGVTYDEKDKILFVSAKDGKVNAYDYEKLEKMSKQMSSFTNKTNKAVTVDVNDDINKDCILSSNIQFNQGVKKADDKGKYQASTIYYDNIDDKLYIAHFGKKGYILASDVTKDKNGALVMSNPEFTTADNGIQGISVYHKDDRTYLVESRSFGKNETAVTVKDATGGVTNAETVGTERLKSYGEGIYIDEFGNSTIVHEKGKDKTMSNVNINNIIEDGNQENPNIRINTRKYEAHNLWEDLFYDEI